MLPVYVRLQSVDGLSTDAIALAKDADGNLLPPGVWRIKYSSGFIETIAVEKMLSHWQEQLRRAGEFGKTLKE